MKLIGSSILKVAFGKDMYRPVRDLDYLCLEKELPSDLKKAYLDSGKPFFFKPNRKVKEEYLVITDNNPLLDIYSEFNLNTEHDVFLLYLIKSSHKHIYLGKYNKSFKHLIDYSFLHNYFKNEYKNLELSTKYQNFINNYNKFLIKEVYNNDPRLTHFPKLNKSKEEFFNDKVTYYVDHDFLHEKVAIEETPAYTKCLAGEVKFSNKLFQALSKQEQINMVLEESMVIALERCLIPIYFGDINVPATSPTEAFKYAITRVATNLTSGPFRNFAANNFKEIYEDFNKHHKDYFKVITQLGI